MGAANLNDDSRSDIVLCGGGFNLHDWPMDGAKDAHVDLITTLTASQSVAQLADLSGDGPADILIHDSTASVTDPWPLLQPGTMATAASYASWPPTG